MRPVIDFRTLQIFKSIQAAASHYGISRQTVFKTLIYNGYTKTSKYHLEYLDVWIRDWTYKEKKEFCIFKNVDFI